MNYYWKFFIYSHVIQSKVYTTVVVRSNQTRLDPCTGRLATHERNHQFSPRQILARQDDEAPNPTKPNAGPYVRTRARAYGSNRPGRAHLHCSEVNCRRRRRPQRTASPHRSRLTRRCPGRRRRRAARRGVAVLGPRCILGTARSSKAKRPAREESCAARTYGCCRRVVLGSFRSL